MTKAELLQSTIHLQQVDMKAAIEYSEKIDYLVSKMNLRMLERDDLNGLVGDENISMMKDNHANHARFIASMLKNHHPEVLVDTVLWVFRAYRSRGFHTNYWAAQLNNWMVVLKEELSEDTYKQVFPLYEWMQVNIPSFVNISDEILDLPIPKH